MEQIHKDRLLATMELVEMEALVNQHDQRTFGTMKRGSETEVCNTAFCFAGWGTQIAIQKGEALDTLWYGNAYDPDSGQEEDFQEAATADVLAMPGEVTAYMDFVVVPGGGWEDVDGWAQKYYGLTVHQANTLFNASNTLSAVRVLVRSLLEQGRLPWIASSIISMEHPGVQEHEAEPFPLTHEQLHEVARTIEKRKRPLVAESA
jgi:hypothetical protein